MQKKSRQLENDLEENILEFPGAKTALERLDNAGMDKQFLLGLLRLAAILATSERKRDLMAGSGITLGVLRRYPKRLRALANEVKQLNSHPLVQPSMWL